MIAALDIGGTHVTAARVDVESASVEPASRCRLQLRPDGNRAELLASVLEAAAAAGCDVDRCGVAVPGPFDYENGICTIRGVGKLEALYGVDLRRELAATLGLAKPASVRFLNDAEAFLLGEAWAGVARTHRRAVGITLGTGLGSAFLADGRIVDEGPAVPPEGSLHLVPFRGAPVEDVISRRGLLARYGAADAALDVERVASRARDGEKQACEAFDHVSRALGEFLDPWLTAFAPSCVVVGGSIARAWDLIRPNLRAALADIGSLEVLAPADNLDDAPLLGAAWYAA